MDDQLRQRLVGAIVLVALAVIFVPMIFEGAGIEGSRLDDSNIPPRPKGEFSSRIVPLEPDTLAEPLEPSVQSPATPSAVELALVDPNPTPGAEPGPKPLSKPESRPAIEAVRGLNGQATDPRVGVTAWAIQLGSFASLDNAKALEARLKGASYSAFVDKVFSESGTVYRVRVGPELLRSEAEQLRDKLEGEVELRGLVVRYP